MRTDPEGQFEAVIVAYGLGDFELAASYFSDDCDYAIYIPTETGPFGGAVIGRAAIFERFQLIARDFQALVYEARPVITLGERIRTQIRYAFRHRASGEEIDGVGRIEATSTDGKIVKWREFHDTDRIQAFVRFCKAKGSTMADAPMDQPPTGLSR